MHRMMIHPMESGFINVVAMATSEHVSEKYSSNQYGELKGRSIYRGSEVR